MLARYGVGIVEPFDDPRLTLLLQQYPVLVGSLQSSNALWVPHLTVTDCQGSTFNSSFGVNFALHAFDFRPPGDS